VHVYVNVIFLLLLKYSQRLNYSILLPMKLTIVRLRL